VQGEFTKTRVGSPPNLKSEKNFANVVIDLASTGGEQDAVVAANDSYSSTTIHMSGCGCWGSFCALN
jgi:hypothetical protein